MLHTDKKCPKKYAGPTNGTFPNLALGPFLGTFARTYLNSPNIDQKFFRRPKNHLWKLSIDTWPTCHFFLIFLI